MTTNLEVKVWRGKEEGDFVTYEVPRLESQTVLDVVSWRPDYLGPAALNRAWTLINDVRDVTNDTRLLAVSGDAGCHSCHTQGSCTERCPKSLAPTAAISGLKRLAVSAIRRKA